jgi:type IV pilus assembly protein PilW
MVAMTVGAIVLAGLFYVVKGQQTAYYQGHLQRGAQGAARAALQYVEERVQMAGFGMDASLAFDFDRYAALPCPAQAAPCQRDRVNGNDELVFYSRNPRYWVPETYDPPGLPLTNPPVPRQPVGNAWRIASVDPNTVIIDAHGQDTFTKGQILQAVCRGAESYAYFTVAATVQVGGARGDIVQGTRIPLAASAAGDPFRRQTAFAPQAGATHPCFDMGTARLFLIDRYRFHVRPVAVPRTRGEGTALGVEYRPYLVLDRGLDTNGSGGPDDDDEIVVAEGIEIFQVAYTMTNGALAPRGTVVGQPIAFAPGMPGVRGGDGMTTLAFPGPAAGISPNGPEYAQTSWAQFAVGPPPDDNRMTDHQANIRGVSIAIVARGADPDPGVDAYRERILPVLNMNAFPPWLDPTTPYNRARLESTVLVRNMVSRGVTDF